MSEHEIIDANGWPRVLNDAQFAELRQRHERQKRHKPGPVRLADAPAPASAAPVELRGRTLLDLRQASAVLSLSLDDASAVLAKMSTPRIVGFSATDVQALAEQLRTDPLLRAELGLKRSGDGSTPNP